MLTFYPLFEYKKLLTTIINLRKIIYAITKCAPPDDMVNSIDSTGVFILSLIESDSIPLHTNLSCHKHNLLQVLIYSKPFRQVIPHDYILQ